MNKRDLSAITNPLTCVVWEDSPRRVYIADSGSDEQGDGTAARPWRTLAYALEHGPSRHG